MESIISQKYLKETVRIDGRRFLKCSFEDCLLHYGGEPCEWEDTTFLNCRVFLDNSAAYAVQVLEGLGFRIIPPGAAAFLD